MPHSRRSLAELDLTLKAPSLNSIARWCLALAGIMLSIASSASDLDLYRDVEGYRIKHESQIVGELAELVRVRSVAADRAGLGAAADLLVRKLKERGFEARQWTAESAAAPLVFGALNSSGARHTVVFYAHYDGQPVTPSQWSSDPFVPSMHKGMRATEANQVDWTSVQSALDPEWRLFGRAVADDKASIVAFLAAMDALKAVGRQPSVNIKVIWEGEEEAGSTHLAKILRDHQTMLGADLWLIGDGLVHQSGKAMLYFGARGVLGLRMTVYGPTKALHDGHYGNWVPNPAALAAQLVAQMRAADGAILIPGLTEGVRALTPDERKAIAELPRVDESLKRQFGIGTTEGSEGLALSLMRPALNIRGLRSGQVGDAAANAIPTDAEISIDFRLVPDQTPEMVRTAVERFLTSGGWTLITNEPDEATRLARPHLIRLEWESGYPALRSSMSTAVARAVIDSASRAARGPVAVMPMMGGSVPLYIFAETFHVPVIGLPIVNYDDNQHAANENLRLGNLWDGIQTYAFMTGELNW
jgi:acetylornithine deacetylase/succinyl-diaminopimelate desuccinylase-like protein